MILAVSQPGRWCSEHSPQPLASPAVSTLPSPSCHVFCFRDWPLQLFLPGAPSQQLQRTRNAWEFMSLLVWGHLGVTGGCGRVKALLPSLSWAAMRGDLAIQSCPREFCLKSHTVCSLSGPVLLLLSLTTLPWECSL